MSKTVQRLRQEYLQIVRCPEPGIYAEPLSTNILEWRFALDGPKGTPYQGGLYQGKLIFPSSYPSGPPEIQMLTPTGRFKTNMPICLLHLKRFTWDPAWSVASVLSGFREFMVHGELTIGSVWFTTDRHKRHLAEDSLRFNLQDPVFCELFPDLAQSCRRRIEERWTKEVEAMRKSVGKGCGKSGDERIGCDDMGMVVFVFVFFLMAGVTGVVTLVCLMK
ncbi:ubiquitin-conjugating enzyme E2 J2-like [Ornithodoros turicata]|uniref:ubiquitin-conjugating enzyme E2 J2-like n=1 Tax=Ornithodoros turicata TaxID=34597 RepID=UPI0031386288